MRFFDSLVSILGISLLAFLARDLLPDDFNVMPRYQYEFTDRKWRSWSKQSKATLTIENISVGPDQVSLVWTSKGTDNNKLIYQEAKIMKFEKCNVIDEDNWTCRLYPSSIPNYEVIQMVNGKLESNFDGYLLQRATKKLKVFGVLIPL